MTTTPTREMVDVHPVEIDLLCDFAEADPPFPLDIPPTGTTIQERRLMFRAAREQLTARGLAGRRGPTGAAAAFVRLLRGGTGCVDLVVSTGDRNVGAVVLVDELRAVVAIQSPDDPDGIVRLGELGVDNAVSVLVSLVPTLDAASVPPFTVPLAPLRRAFDFVARQPGANGSQERALCDADIDDLLRACGLDDRLADRLAVNLRSVVGNGQAGAARRAGAEGRWRRLGDDVRWVDTARGRFRLAEDETTRWVSVNPFSRNDVRSTLRALGARARAVAR